ncbi:MAG: hypothetical protein AAFX54_03055 [Pseudomonadota bacterium]
MRNIILFAGLLSVAASPAAAGCYKVTVKNESNKPVSAFWRALGCAGVTEDYSVVCNSATIKPGDKKSYNYKWGTTLPKVSVSYTYKHSNEAPRLHENFVYQNGSFKTSNRSHSVPSCGKSYSFSVTQSDIERMEKKHNKAKH